MGKGRTKPNHRRLNHNPGHPDAGDQLAVHRSTQRWDVLPSTNAAFVEYYKNQQRIVPSEPEWDQLFASLRSDLPTTFRVTGGKKNAIRLNQIIHDTYVPFLSHLKINDELVPPPQPISWYPNQLAWEFRASKQLIRKSSELKKFQNFLVYETEAGNLSRQEAVSMIPPLLLDLQSHHYVLDTCAAPGSKTAQLVESLHHSDPGSIPQGLIIANDSDYKRSHLLVHQSLRRLPSPSTMITNHDASRFPTLSMNGKKLYFDRILCDVPCSGDGTMRKNGGIWRDWTPANGIGLHGLQLRILSRAISLLKPGGRIVYSTCSLNPLENEAVVSAALSQFPSMKLKDVSDRLPGLIRRPGLTTWTVTTRDPSNIQPLASPDDIPDLPANKKYPSTLWPNGKEDEFGLQHCIRIYPHLQDTGGFFVAVLEKLGDPNQTFSSTNSVGPPVRSEPHPTATDDNKAARTVNQKTPELDPSHVKLETDTEKESSSECHTITQIESKQIKREVSIDENIPSTDQPDKKRVKIKSQLNGTIPKSDNASEGVCSESQSVPSKAPENKSVEKDEPLNNPFKEEPHVYLKPDNDEIKQCIECFGIKPTFPVDNLLVRNAEGIPNRNIYLTSSVVREVIENNTHNRLRLICCGVKILGKQEPSASTMKGSDLKGLCKWRIVSDGIEFLRPFMSSKRIVKCHLKTLKDLMSIEDHYPLIENLKDSDFKSQVQSLQLGSYIAEIFDDGEEVNENKKDEENIKAEGEEKIAAEGLEQVNKEEKEKETIKEEKTIKEEEGEKDEKKVKVDRIPLDLMVGLWISKLSINLMIDKKDRKVLSLRLWGSTTDQQNQN